MNMDLNNTVNHQRASASIRGSGQDDFAKPTNGVEFALRRRLERGQKNLVPFFTAGFPNSTMFLALLRAAQDMGCDAIEVGIPFSDPIADGPAIQFSNDRVLGQGMNVSAALKLVACAKLDIPVLLMGYLNPIRAYGIPAFVEDAGAVGIAGVIIPDLPLVSSRNPVLGMDFRMLQDSWETVYMAAPTTTPQRLAALGRATRGFLYAVTVTGITGARQGLPRGVEAFLRNVRKATVRPILAGFGISDPQQARAIARHCDGVIVGSALIDQIRSGPQRGAVKRASRLLRQLREVL